MRNRIVFLTLYDENRASAKFRVFQYLPYLKENYNIIILPLITKSKAYFCDNVNPKNYFNRIYYWLLRNSYKYFKRIRDLKLIKKDDIVFVQKDFLFNWFLKKLKKKTNKIIYDFDDSIFTSQNSTNIFINNILKNQFKKIVENSKIIISANSFLKKYAELYNKNTVILPTMIKYEENYAEFDKTKNKLIKIGWMGSGPQHIEDLKLISNIIDKLNKNYEFELHIIGTMGSPKFKKLFPNIKNYCEHEWLNFNEMIKLISTFDISLCPLRNTDFNNGKCPMKTLITMLNKNAVIGSPVGLNKQIIENNETGFLAETENEWYQHLELLINNSELRKKIGENAYNFIKINYTIENNYKKFIKIIENVL